MDWVTRVQILDETISFSFYDYALGKGMNPTILFPATDK